MSHGLSAGVRTHYVTANGVRNGLPSPGAHQDQMGPVDVGQCGNLTTPPSCSYYLQGGK